MASNGDHVIDIVIETSDQTGDGLSQAQNRLTRFDRSVQRMNERLKKITGQAHQVTLSLVDKVTPEGSKVQQWLRRIADRTHQITLGLTDHATNGLKATEAKLLNLTSKAHTVTVNLKNQATQGLKNIGDNVLQSATGFSGQMIAGAGIGYGVYDTVQTYKNFEQQMSAVGSIATAGKGAEESKAIMEQLTEKAMEMGAKTSFSATESAKAFEYMAMAGWKAEEMMGGISGIMNLAAASGEDLGMVSDIVTDALTAFKLEAKDAGHFADVLATASANSNTNVGKMGYTFKYVAPVAGAMGQSIEDMATAIGLLANAGIKGEQAGTSLRYIMSQMTDESSKARKEFASLGVSIIDENGKMRPFMQIVKDTRAAFSQLTDAEKTQAATNIAGVEGMSAWLAMMGASEKSVNDLEKALRNADGAAEEMSKKRMDNLAGDLQLLGSAWETLQLKIMQGNNGGFLREFVRGVKTDVEKFTKYIEDGFDISDIGRIAIDVLVQLKNKFLELDGVGSILAGGALAGALAKITSKTMKLIDYFKNLSNPSISGGTGGGASSQSVGVMNVHADVVNLNGSGNNSNLPDVPSGSSDKAPTKTGKSGSRLARGAKIATAAGGLLTAGFAAYDIYSTSQYNDQMTEEADWDIQETQKRYSEANDKAYIADELFKEGDISQEERDKAFADWNKAADDFTKAMDYQKRVEEQNKSRMNTSVGEGIGGVGGFIAGAQAGAVTGGAIGAAFGGVGAAPGAAVGGLIGGIGGAFAGSELGATVGANWDSLKTKATETWDSIKTSASEAWESISSSVGEMLAPIGEALQPLEDAAITALNFFVGLGSMILEPIMEAVSPLIDWFNESVWTPLAETATEAWTAISESPGEAIAFLSELWSSFSSWFSETVWTPISDAAGAAWDVISNYAATTWEVIASFFEPAASWFDSTVWSPISSAVDSVKSAITGAFEAAWSAVTGLWGAAAGWFETNVIAPVRDKFNAIVAKGASITGLGGGAEAKAYGGFVTSPRTILAGEDGGEVIIPLSPNKRSRAMGLFERTAEILNAGGSLGMISGADIFNPETEEPLPDNIAGITPSGDVSDAPIGSTTNNAGSNAVSVEMGGVNISLNVDGGDNPKNIADNVLQVIRENIERIADDAGGKMAEKLSAIWGNQPAWYILKKGEQSYEI